MEKNAIKLNESTLRQIVAESVKKVLKEIGDTPQGKHALAAVQGRAFVRKQDARQAGNDAEYQKQQQIFDDADDAMKAGWEQGYPKAKAAGDTDRYSYDMAQADAKGFQYGVKKGKNSISRQI